MKLWDGSDATTLAYDGGTQVALVGESGRVVVAKRSVSLDSIQRTSKVGVLLIAGGMATAIAGYAYVEALTFVGLAVFGLGVALSFGAMMMKGKLSNALHHETLPQSAVVCIADVEEGALLDAYGDRLASLKKVKLETSSRNGATVLALVWPDGELVITSGPAPSVEEALRKTRAVA